MIAFCIDANLETGLGHLYRTLSVANLYKKNNKKFIFVIINKKKKINLENIINSKIYTLNSNKRKNKIIQLKKILSENNINQIFFDSYFIDKNFISSFKKYKTIVLNDFFDKDLKADININSGYVAENFKNNKNNYFFGSKFSCLNDEYLKYIKLNTKSYIKKKKLIKKKNILIYFGTFENSLKIYHILYLKLKKKIFDNYSFDFIFGSEDSKKKFNNLINYKKKNNFKFYGYIKSLGKILYKSCFAITGSGLINHEKVSLGVPSISVLLSKNQHQSVKFLKKNDILQIYKKKQFINLKSDKLLKIFNLKNKNIPEKMFLNDAYGARRVYRLINEKSLSLKLRKADLNDIFFYFNWVNQISVRKNSLNKNRITFNEHEKWFNKKLDQKKNYLYISIDENNLPLGQVRYDFSNNDKKYYVDISVDEFYRNKGLGKKILKLTLKKLEIKKIKKKIYSIILKKNKSSLKIFMHNNFKIIKELKNYYLLKYNEN